MSVNRENVTWRRADGTYAVGFYDFVYTGGEDGDPEWDVEYLDRFGWASAGHCSADAAAQAWPGANPGGGHVHEDPTPETLTDLEAKLAAYLTDVDPALLDGPTRRALRSTR